jgi:hypothetical protein
MLVLRIRLTLLAEHAERVENGHQEGVLFRCFILRVGQALPHVLEQRQAACYYQDTSNQAEPERGLKWSEKMVPRHVFIGRRFHYYHKPVEIIMLLYRELVHKLTLQCWKVLKCGAAEGWRK